MATIVRQDQITRPTYHEITRDIAATLGSPSRTYYVLLGIVVAVFAVSVGALLSFYVAGVVEAEVRFKPVIRKTRKRELPDELKAPQSQNPQIRFDLGLTGGRIRVDF